jgi:hypothetical protein
MTAKELKLDYFKIYDVKNVRAAGAVTLKGQFDRAAQKFELALLDFFANPVAKNAEPLYDRNAHLAWYRGVQGREPMRRVLVDNQFGRAELRLLGAAGLLVPTEKIERGSAFPEALDHYKVYAVAEGAKSPQRELKLQDQFGRDEVRLGVPQFFAVPVAKKRGEKVFPIRNSRAHLVIYAITPRDLQKNLTLKNQFSSAIKVSVVRSVMLAAPSLKVEWKQE